MLNKISRRQYDLNRYHSKRNQFIQQLGGKCARCGSTENLEFDHINSDEKKIDIAHRMFCCDDILQNELKKCQLLCRSCHIQKTKEEKDSRAKISNTDAINIRKEYAENNITQEELGRKYGISQVEIGNILRGVKWIQNNENPFIQAAIDKKREQNINALRNNHKWQEVSAQKRSISVNMIDLKTDEVLKTYKSIKDTEKDGFNADCVARCCRDQLKTHNGYGWKFNNK